MTRTKLSDRRPSVTERLEVDLVNQTQIVLVTIGFADDGSPREVFCADWKAGTAMHAFVTDSCILVSRLLQHGDSATELYATLCRPPSLVGQIIGLCARYEESR